MFRRAAALQIRLAFVQSFLPERFSGVAPSAAMGLAKAGTALFCMNL